MKKSMIFIFFIAASLATACFDVDIQTFRQIDPARFKEIDYPALTDREGVNLTLPVPPPEHPRLFFRKSDIETIKKNAENPLLQDLWSRVRLNSIFPTDGKLRQGVSHNYDLQTINVIEARAFMYAVTGDKNIGNEAVNYIFNMHNTLIINPQSGNVFRDIGRIILATAAVYDWCYDLIPLAEKNSLIAIMESLAADMEVRWPRLVQGSVVGHGTEAQLARDILSFGIAVYDEKPEIYQRVAGRIFAEFIPAQNYAYLSGHHHQGSAYGPYRYLWEVYTTLIFDRMGYPNITSEFQGKMPYYWIYTRRPDGQLFRDGDDFKENSNDFGQYWSYSGFAYVASYYKDPLLMGEAIRQKNIGDDPIYDLLLIDPAVSADNNLAALPLTRYFPSPLGGMVARTGWNTDVSLTSNTVVAEMRIKERQFNNHQHFDAGNFQIYYKGPLAVNSGIYEGTQGGYGSSHFMNYYQRTIAHNCMLVYNPTETFRYGSTNYSNDGGQRFVSGGTEPSAITQVMSNEFKTGEVVAYDFGPNTATPEYSYLKGDITQAYTNKVRNHQRAFVFLNLNSSQVPAAMIVYDYVVSSNRDFKKTWLLHCVQEPVFNGNVCTVTRNERGYNGKLVNTVLLPAPENTLLTKVGGAGNEFSVAGRNYPQQLSNRNNSNDGAVWRIELSPKTPSETDVFLNVMQVTDAGNNRLLAVEQVETERQTGVKIGDRIVLFSKNGNIENLPVNLNIRGSGTFKVLITDLVKGDWEITGPRSSQTQTVRNDNNLVYFQATEGNYVITRKLLQ